MHPVQASVSSLHSPSESWLALGWSRKCNSTLSPCGEENWIGQRTAKFHQSSLWIRYHPQDQSAPLLNRSLSSQPGVRGEKEVNTGRGTIGRGVEGAGSNPQHFVLGLVTVASPQPFLLDGDANTLIHLSPFPSSFHLTWRNCIRNRQLIS